MTNPPFSDTDAFDAIEDLAQGGTWLLDLVAAVDDLRRGHRPGLTVWDAFSEALNWYVDGSADDRIHPAIAERSQTGARIWMLGQDTDMRGAIRAQVALRRWIGAMATRYNGGQHWPHPAPGRGFPPPAIDM